DAIAPEMEETSHELLARAALALHEHGGPTRRHTTHEVEHGAARCALGDDRLRPVPRAHLLAEKAILALEAREIERARHERPELVVVERLRQVVEGALAHGGDGGRHRAVR